MNLLVTGAWGSAKEHISTLESMGHTVIFMQYEKDALLCDYSWVEGVICNGLFLTHDISFFTNLRYIQLTSAGYDRVPMEYINEHNIEIHNARGVYSIPMAEFAVAGVLNLYKKMEYFRCNQQKHKWDKNRNLLELYGKTVCIIGCGSVGTECAKRFGAFGCKVIGLNSSPKMDENYKEILPLDKMNDVISKSDIVVLALPLKEDTLHLMNEGRLSLLKKDSILVNISRGQVVDTEALIKILPNIGGAVLDVFEQEPLGEESPLWDMDNVIVTPHNSFVGDGDGERLAKQIISFLENTN